MGRQPARNAANLAALAGLLPKPKERPSRPNPNHQQDSGGSAVGERPHWSPPAQGDHDPAGDPRRRRFSGVDSAANSNSAFKARQNGEALLLSDLIVRSGVPRASVQHGDPDGPGEEEEVEEGKQQKGEWQKDQMAASRWNLAGEQSDLLEESEEVSSSASALSPLRKLIRSPWNFITSPWKNRGLPPRLGRGGGPKKRGRGVLATPRIDTKASKNKEALEIARRLGSRNLSRFPIEDDFDASSAKQAKSARRETLEKLLISVKGKDEAYPLSAQAVKALASVLKMAGYKAGPNYLTEAKLVHVEMGYPWNSMLDRALFQCKRALDRDRGPRKKAPEVPEENWTRSRLASATAANKLVKFAKETFVFAMIWLLREIEMSRMTTSEVEFDFMGKKVTLHWRSSKTDQRALGTSRALQCLCRGGCEQNCPYRVSFEFVRKLEKTYGTGAPLCMDKNGAPASKHLVIKAWCMSLNFKVTGHSARRTGALRYVRLGWAISQIAYLGRWKSNVVYSYAEEALELVAVNASLEHRRDKPVVDADTGEVTEDWKTVLKEELKLFKSKVSQEVKASKDMVIFWKDLFDKNVGNLPPQVLSTSSKVVHSNVQCPSTSPPLTWRTTCGWRYYGSSFSFLNAEAVTCVKCLQLCAA